MLSGDEFYDDDVTTGILTTLSADCALCHRSAPILNGTYIRVSWSDGSVKDICDDCFGKADEGEDLDETLDMTDGREGLPEFNGAFG